jgi:hypothetical protein
MQQRAAPPARKLKARAGESGARRLRGLVGRLPARALGARQRLPAGSKWFGSRSAREWTSTRTRGPALRSGRRAAPARALLQPA